MSRPEARLKTAACGPLCKVDDNWPFSRDCRAISVPPTNEATTGMLRLFVMRSCLESPRGVQDRR